MTTRLSGSAVGTEAMQAAQRGFAAFGAAQEMVVKAWMRAATRQAELTRESLSDCMTAMTGMHLPTGPEDGQEQMRRAGLAAETWLRTWRSIADEFGHDLAAATDAMMAGIAQPPASTAMPPVESAKKPAPRR